MPVHKHLIIRAEVRYPITSERELKKWLRNLVKKIDMKIIKGPYAAYVSKEGNRGLTGIVMIETSHISIHIWDEDLPALVQCDVYSCEEFSTSEVLRHLFVMRPVKTESTLHAYEIEHLLLDRGKTIELRRIDVKNAHRHMATSFSGVKNVEN